MRGTVFCDCLDSLGSGPLETARVQFVPVPVSDKSRLSFQGGERGGREGGGGGWRLNSRCAAAPSGVSACPYCLFSYR